jgi:hypothetical protein
VKAMREQPKTAASCKLHPKYKVIRPPTSRKLGCTCWLAWRRKQDAIVAMFYGGGNK